MVISQIKKWNFLLLLVVLNIKGQRKGNFLAQTCKAHDLYNFIGCVLVLITNAILKSNTTILYTKKQRVFLVANFVKIVYR